MKTRNIISLWVILCGLLVFSSCLEKYDYEEVTGPPQIAFSTSDTVFIRQEGSVLELKAIVVQGKDVQHIWTFDDKVCSQTATLSLELNDSGIFTLKYEASDMNGITSKQFKVEVVKGDIEGVVFSTTESEFTKSIGESLHISVTIRGNDPVSHEWKVNGEVYSTSDRINFPIVESGEYEVVYKITKGIQELEKTFYLTAIKSDFGNWFAWQDMKEYVICLKDDETKVVTHNSGSLQFTMETYNGNNNQKFMKGAYFGYGDANVKLEYSNIYNIGTQMTLNEKAEIVSADVNGPGECAADGWRGWYFIIDENANARMVHFLETWDYEATYTVGHKGCIMRASDDKKSVIPLFYDRCKVDGIRDYSDYEALEGQYYDFKIKAVEDM